MSGDHNDDLPPKSWPWLHDFARWLGTRAFTLPFRLRIHHQERIPATGRVVLVCNHLSMWDGPLLFGIVRRRSVFLIKQEMFRNPLMRVLLFRIGQLAIRAGQADRAPLTAALRVLRAEGLVGIFPEGSRGAGDVEAAENGAAWLARATHSMVLPVACRGTRRRVGDRSFRRRVDVLFGEQFQLKGAPGRSGLAVDTERIRMSLTGLVAELDELRG